MQFDWQKFLDAHGIEFATRGPNVGRGQVAIHCPFCGADDPSHHMSVSLEGRGWRCWRRKDAHYGRNPARLVQALLGCTWEHAASITGADNLSVAPDWSDRVHKLLAAREPGERHGVALPGEFRPFKLSKISPVVRPYVDYITRRGLDWHNLTRRYQAYFAVRGPWKGRVVFAVYYEGQLASWVGRTIYPEHEPRYLALTADPEKAARLGVSPAAGPLTDYLLWYDELRATKADTLCVCEGPFDALKVRALGRDHGVTATCLFTSAPSRHQLDCLHELLPRFRRRVSLLDADTLPASIRMSGDLAGLGVEIMPLPRGLKDPGEIVDAGQLLKIIAPSRKSV